MSPSITLLSLLQVAGGCSEWSAARQHVRSVRGGGGRGAAARWMWRHNARLWCARPRHPAPSTSDQWSAAAQWARTPASQATVPNTHHTPGALGLQIFYIQPPQSTSSAFVGNVEWVNNFAAKQHDKIIFFTIQLNVSVSFIKIKFLKRFKTFIAALLNVCNLLRAVHHEVAVSGHSVMCWWVFTHVLNCCYTHMNSYTHHTWAS